MDIVRLLILDPTTVRGLGVAAAAGAGLGGGVGVGAGSGSIGGAHLTLTARRLVIKTNFLGLEGLIFKMSSPSEGVLTINYFCSPSSMALCQQLLIVLCSTR